MKEKKDTKQERRVKMETQALFTFAQWIGISLGFAIITLSLVSLKLYKHKTAHIHYSDKREDLLKEKLYKSWYEITTLFIIIGVAVIALEILPNCISLEQSTPTNVLLLKLEIYIGVVFGSISLIYASIFFTLGIHRLKYIKPSTKK